MVDFVICSLISTNFEIVLYEIESHCSTYAHRVQKMCYSRTKNKQFGNALIFLMESYKDEICIFSHFYNWNTISKDPFEIDQLSLDCV